MKEKRFHSRKFACCYVHGTPYIGTLTLLYPRPHRVEALSDDARLTCLSDVCLSVAYIGPKSRTDRPKKTNIGTEVANATRDSDTTFKVRKSKVNLFDGQKRPSLRPYSAVLGFVLTVSAQTC